MPHPSCDKSEEIMSQRLDVWLFRTRLVKSRSLASKLVQGRKVRLTRHGQTMRVEKAHTKILPGDEIVFMRGREVVHVMPTAMPHRRGPAPEAQQHYQIMQSER